MINGNSRLLCDSFCYLSTRDLDLHFTRYQHFASTEKKKRTINRRKSKEIVLDFDIQRQIDPRRRTFGDLTQGTRPRRIPSTMQLMVLFFVFHRPPRFQCPILRRWQPSAALVFVPEANGIAGVRPNRFEPFFSGEGGLNGGLGERGEGGAAPATGPPADLAAEVVERWRRLRCSEQE